MSSHTNRRVSYATRRTISSRNNGPIICATTTEGRYKLTLPATSTRRLWSAWINAALREIASPLEPVESVRLFRHSRIAYAAR